MKVTISNKNKKDLFVALFQILKGCTSIVRVIFKQDKMYIQGMDKSHICLFEVNIQKAWFDEYIVNEPYVVSFDTNIFHLIISTKQESHNIIIHSISGEDNINIDLESQEHTKGEFNKHFKIPLVDYDYDEMNIPVVDYDAEFSISSKKICEITTQMLAFGTDLNIKCSEERIDLVTDGSATLRYKATVTAISANVNVTLSRPATSTATNTLSFRDLKTNTALLKGWSVTG